MIKTGKDYWRIKYTLFGIDIVITILVLSFLLISGFSKQIASWSASLTNNPYVSIFFYLVVFGAIFFVVKLPFSFYESFTLEHKFNLSNLTIGKWVKKQAKQILISGFIGILAMEVLYVFLRKFPGTWWILFGIFWGGFSILLTKLLPVFIIPLFYKYAPLKDEVLKFKLMDMIKKHGIGVRGIFTIDMSKETKKANAALVGFGSTRRVILSDTLLADYTHEEMEAILAHELGHHKYLHMWKLTGFGLLCTFVSLYAVDMLLKENVLSFGFGAIYDIGLFPFFYFLIFLLGLIFTPIQNGFSRVLENRADKFALSTTGNPDAFISTMQKLSKQNLSDANPNKFIEIVFYNHPPIQKRIETAKELLKE